MTLYGYIVHESPVRLWGLTSRQRLLQVLAGAGIHNVVDDIASLPEDGSVVLLRGDYLFDERVVNYLVQTADILLEVSAAQKKEIVAAHVSSAMARKAHAAMQKDAPEASLPGVRAESLETLSVSFQERLRKFEPPFVLPITPENRRALERRLFDWSYKGVTDLVTKWAWPRPARWAVGQCVRFGLRPNHVTVASLVLGVLASVFFAEGWYGWGLLTGWVMTFLDTVDGKLARVTVASSRFGHYFDHIIDIVHPPVWYVLWGIGLGESHLAGIGISVNFALWLLFAFYAVGRFVEATFTLWLGKFGLFCWRPVDSYFRLITGRRNPNMILLTVLTVFGRSDLGLLAVVLWTVLTSLFMAARLAMAGYVRLTRGPLWTWLREARSRCFLLLAPTSTGTTWSILSPEVDGAAITSVLEDVRRKWDVDSDRILLTGISDGGTFALVNSLQSGSPFSDFAVIACVLPPADLQMARGKRIYWVHGALDWMFPVKDAQRAAKMLEQAGAHITLRVVHDLSHTYPRDENARILEWFRVSMT